MTFPPRQPPPPPPPGHRPAPPQPRAPQGMGPGGAYGPVETPAGQPIPGHMPPPEMTMSKPGTVTGIQAILWTFMALGVIGDFLSIASLVDAFHPLGLIAVVYALYTTVQSLLTPVHISRGKRWAWIWSLVSAVLGLVLSVVVIVMGVATIEYTPLPLIVGVVLAALEGTLLGLLVSRSARDWILMHRIRRGEVEVQGSPGGPGAGAAATVVEVERDRPEAKPGSVTAVQLLLWLVALRPVAMVYAVVSDARHQLAAEPQWYEGETLGGMLLGGSDYTYVLGAALAVVVLLLVLAVISAVGLQRGRFWSRVFSPIWVGVVVLLSPIWVAVSIVWFTTFGDEALSEMTRPAMLTMIAVACCAFVFSVTAFVMMFMRGARSWAPGRRTVVVGGPGPVGPVGPAQHEPVGPWAYPPRYR